MRQSAFRISAVSSAVAFALAALWLPSLVLAQAGGTAGSRRPLGAAAFTVLASAARTDTAGTAGTATTGLESYTQGECLLDVTAAATDVGDTLNVRLQKSPDGGTTWTDWISYTQVLGNGGTKQLVAGWREAGPENEEYAVQPGTAGATSQRTGMIGDRVRAHWVIVDTVGDDASFTFAVRCIFKE